MHVPKPRSYTTGITSIKDNKAYCTPYWGEPHDDAYYSDNSPVQPDPNFDSWCKEIAQASQQHDAYAAFQQANEKIAKYLSSLESTDPTFASQEASDIWYDLQKQAKNAVSRQGGGRVTQRSTTLAKPAVQPPVSRRGRCDARLDALEWDESDLSSFDLLRE